jgi:hypothetical protein
LTVLGRLIITWRGWAARIERRIVSSTSDVDVDEPDGALDRTERVGRIC